MATRDVSVLPKSTTVAGAGHRAVESTYPWLSAGGAADTGDDTAMAHVESPAARHAEATVKRDIMFHHTTTIARARGSLPRYYEIVRYAKPSSPRLSLPACSASPLRPSVGCGPPARSCCALRCAFPWRLSPWRLRPR